MYFYDLSEIFILYFPLASSLIILFLPPSCFFSSVLFQMVKNYFNFIKNTTRICIVIVNWMKINCVLRDENFSSFAGYICLEIKHKTYKNKNRTRMSNSFFLLLRIKWNKLNKSFMKLNSFIIITEHFAESDCSEENWYLTSPSRDENQLSSI